MSRGVPGHQTRDVAHENGDEDGKKMQWMNSEMRVIKLMTRNMVTTVPVGPRKTVKTRMTGATVIVPDDDGDAEEVTDEIASLVYRRFKAGRCRRSLCAEESSDQDIGGFCKYGKHNLNIESSLGSFQKPKLVPLQEFLSSESLTSFERVFSGANSDATVVIQGWLASDYREMNRCQRGEELTMIPKSLLPVTGCRNLDVVLVDSSRRHRYIGKDAKKTPLFKFRGARAQVEDRMYMGLPASLAKVVKFGPRGLCPELPTCRFHQQLSPTNYISFTY
ncbi:hypothetical protein BC827DRAFT_1158087 [Russula dissimulans]|nr:hypothetical protein BC827DRAFT_1158087 [Russula dissimulans]